MKKISLYVLILISVVQCRKESEDCHFFITIQNYSSQEIVFGFSGFPLDASMCTINNKIEVINPNESHEYRPYPHPDCIERAINSSGSGGILINDLYIIDPSNFTTDIIPCEEFEQRNTILRTYILTLEDLERLNYTINYPEDVSIGVE